MNTDGRCPAPLFLIMIMSREVLLGDAPGGSEATGSGVGVASYTDYGKENLSPPPTPMCHSPVHMSAVLMGKGHLA